MVRGRRVVRVVVGSSESVAAVVRDPDVEVSLDDVPDVLDVEEDVEDDEESAGLLMSLVIGGLVLVIVWVVVVVAAAVVLLENEGSTKLSGACSGSPNWRATNDTANTMRAMAASPRRLAPITSGVRLCQGTSDELCRSSSRVVLPRPVTATDSNRGVPATALSAQLRDDLAGEEIHVVEVVHVENLQIDPLHSGLGVGAELVGDLGGGADQRGVAA